jgi:hypothetical protein
MPRLNLCPNPNEAPLKFRDKPEYSAATRRAAMLYWDLARGEYSRNNMSLTYALKRALKDVPQVPLEEVLSPNLRFKAARYLSPNYVKAFRHETLSETGSGPMAVCCEHPHARFETTTRCWDACMRRLSAETQRWMSGIPVLPDIIDILSGILDNRIDTVLVLNCEQYGGDKWILSDRNCDGWQRYMACPRPGLWDRLDQRWIAIEELLEKEGKE